MPAIAVVMPVYNRADRVGGAIASVLAQDFTDFELIVVDDGSTDGTADVIAAIDDPRLRLLRQPRNLGGNAARNRGIQTAASPLVCMIDSDDAFLPGKLAFVAGYFARNPGADVLIDSYRLVYPPHRAKRDTERLNPRLSHSAEVERWVFARKLFNATPSLSARRDALQAVGLFDETLKRWQDVDLILRLTRSAHCATTSEVLWVKHWSADSISADKQTYLSALIELCRRHPAYTENPEFRTGLGFIVARHFLRQTGHARIRLAGRDLGRCIGYFGWTGAARLLTGGTIEILRRAFRISHGVSKPLRAPAEVFVEPAE